MCVLYLCLHLCSRPSSTVSLTAHLLLASPSPVLIGTHLLLLLNLLRCLLSPLCRLLPSFPLDSLLPCSHSLSSLLLLPSSASSPSASCPLLFPSSATTFPPPLHMGCHLSSPLLFLLNLLLPSSPPAPLPLLLPSSVTFPPLILPSSASFPPLLLRRCLSSSSAYFLLCHCLSSSFDRFFIKFSDISTYRCIDRYPITDQYRSPVQDCSPWFEPLAVCTAK